MHFICGQQENNEGSLSSFLITVANFCFAISCFCLFFLLFFSSLIRYEEITVPIETDLYIYT